MRISDWSSDGCSSDLFIAEARRQGIPDSWLLAARQSPVYKMACEWKVAFPLHPEYRTLPMVWYIPPLSPIQSAAEAGHMPHKTVGKTGVIPDVSTLRIPMRYLANLLTAGDEAPVQHEIGRASCRERVCQYV